MASITRKQLQKLKELAAQLDECPTCQGVSYIGIPHLFITLNTPNGQHSKSWRGGIQWKGDPEVFERFFNGCPTCGKDVKSYPIIFSGLRKDGTRGKQEVPDPWPVNQWPPLGPVERGDDG